MLFGEKKKISLSSWLPSWHERSAVGLGISE